MKRIMTLVLLLFLIVPISVQGLKVSMSDTTGSKGDTVEVPIYLSEALDVGSMDILLKYNSDVLKATAVKTGDLGKNALMESSTAEDGEVRIVLADASGINGNGPVAIISFDVISDTGSTSELVLDTVLVSNLDLVDIISTTEDGTFSVTEAFPLNYIIAVLVVVVVIIVIFAVKKRK